MMKLSSFFKRRDVKKDAFFACTNYSNSRLKSTCTFVLDKKNLRAAVRNPNVSAIITYDELCKEVVCGKGVAVSAEPKKDFFTLHNKIFETSIRGSWLHSISETASISKKATVEHGVIIEDGARIEDFAVIYSGSILKKNVYVGPHAGVGVRGMHNTFIDEESFWVEDAGGVVLEEGVQVLSHATIQKPYFYEMTTVGKNTIVSLHANIGHGCKVGKNTMVAGHAQIAGYCEIGDGVWVGPSVSVAHGVKISDNAKLLIGSVVIDDILCGQAVSGNFSLTHSYNMKFYSLSLREAKKND